MKVHGGRIAIGGIVLTFSFVAAWAIEKAQPYSLYVAIALALVGVAYLIGFVFDSVLEL